MKSLNLKGIGLVCLSTLSLSAMAAQMNMDFSGDLRYRHEKIGAPDVSDQNRQRIRARLKAKAKVNDNLSATLRIASGGTGATSTNSTLEGAGANKAVGLDQAFLKWNVFGHGSHVLAGKMSNPYVRPGKSNLIWDTDYTPEGIALNLQREMGKFTPFIHLSGMWLDDKSGTANGVGDGDNLVYATQFGTKYKCEKLWMTVGFGIHNYSSLQGSNGISRDNNSTDANGNFATNFNVTQIMAEAGTKIGSVKTSLVLDLISNGDAEQDDKGYLVGAKISWKKFTFKADHRRLEADSTLSTITDGDSAGGGTNISANTFSLGSKVTKNVKLSLKYIAGTQLATKKHKDTVQLDAVLKF